MVLGVLVVYFVFDFGLGYSDCRVCRFWFALFICLVVGLLGCVFCLMMLSFWLVMLVVLWFCFCLRCWLSIVLLLVSFWFDA